MSERPDHAGHRRRLRQRFLEGGPDALPDYELIEMILFAASARADMKPVAKALMRRFGSFADVISADPQHLQAVPGVGEGAIAALKSVQAAAQRLLRAQAMARPVMTSWQSVLDYCRAAMAHETREQFRLLFLNRKNMLIADEVQQEGTVDQTAVYPREVIKRALELGASAIVMVHNHPTTPVLITLDHARSH